MAMNNNLYPHSLEAFMDMQTKILFIGALSALAVAIVTAVVNIFSKNKGDC